jgi:hypothetical protein
MGDLGEALRRSLDALNRGDFDAAVAPYADDAILATTVGEFAGRDSIRGFLEDWLDAYDQFVVELDAIENLSDSVTLATFHQRGRLTGGNGFVEVRHPIVAIWVDDLIEQLITSYTDIDEAGAAARRLADEWS